MMVMQARSSELCECTWHVDGNVAHSDNAVLHSVDVGNDAIRHRRTVLLPVTSVLQAALVVVTNLAMNEKNAEIHRVEERHGAREA